MEKTIESYVLGLGWSRSSTQIHENAGSHCQKAFPSLLDSASYPLLPEDATLRQGARVEDGMPPDKLWGSKVSALLAT